MQSIFNKLNSINPKSLEEIYNLKSQLNKLANNKKRNEEVLKLANNIRKSKKGGSKKVKMTIGKDGKRYYFKNGKRVSNPKR